MSTRGSTVPEAIVQLPTASLWPGPGNLRGPDVGPADAPALPEPDPELAASIKALGVIEPLIVRERGAGGFEIIAGHRRAGAAILAGLDTVPAVIRELSETLALQVALVENLQREDLTPVEEARGIRRLLDTGMPRATAAKELGRSKSHVSKRLALLKLPAAAQAYLDAGKLRVEDALSLAVLEEPDVNKVLFELERMQYRRASEVEDLVQKVATQAAGRGQNGNKAPAKTPPAPLPDWGPSRRTRPPKEQRWEVSTADLETFRELCRRHVTQAAAVRKLERAHARRNEEWERQDLVDFLAIAMERIKQPRRRAGKAAAPDGIEGAAQRATIDGLRDRLSNLL
jgi:ParB/RepB/Spo0J family partition protein